VPVPMQAPVQAPAPLPQSPGGWGQTSTNNGAHRRS
jgi:hypothetical protein